jgi:hypothetical protein
MRRDRRRRRRRRGCMGSLEDWISAVLCGELAIGPETGGL